MCLCTFVSIFIYMFVYVETRAQCWIFSSTISHYIFGWHSCTWLGLVACESQWPFCLYLPLAGIINTHYLTMKLLCGCWTSKPTSLYLQNKHFTNWGILTGSIVNSLSDFCLTSMVATSHWIATRKKGVQVSPHNHQTVLALIRCIILIPLGRTISLSQLVKQLSDILYLDFTRCL